MSKGTRRLVRGKSVMGLVLLLVLYGLLLTVGACEDLGTGASVPTGDVSEVAGPTATPAGAVSTQISDTTLPPAPTVPSSTATTSSATTTSSTLDLGMLQMEMEPVQALLPPKRYEDTHPYLQWVGTWTSQTNSAHSGGSARSSGTLNSRVGIEFEGTGVRLISKRSEIAGNLLVHLYGDGVDISDTIHLGGIVPTQYAAVAWSSGTLPEGQYQCWFGYDPANTIEEGVWVDAIDVWGTVLQP